MKGHRISFEDVRIRVATPNDIDAVDALIRELATYEHLSHQVIATKTQLRDALFSDTPHVYCHVVENDDSVIGFALWFLTYSTFEGATGIYLEDLFVHPEFRGLGIGKALLQEVAAIAVEKNCPRLQWEVLDWNTPAIDFYSAMGAEFMDTWRNVRVTGVALQRLAGSGQQ